MYPCRSHPVKLTRGSFIEDDGVLVMNAVATHSRAMHAGYRPLTPSPLPRERGDSGYIPAYSVVGETPKRPSPTGRGDGVRGPGFSASAQSFISRSVKLLRQDKSTAESCRIAEKCAYHSHLLQRWGEHRPLRSVLFTRVLLDRCAKGSRTGIWWRFGNDTPSRELNIGT